MSHLMIYTEEQAQALQHRARLSIEAARMQPMKERNALRAVQLCPDILNHLEPEEAAIHFDLLEVPLDEINIPNPGAAPERQRYVSELTNPWPVILVRQGAGYDLLDGGHRIARAREGRASHIRSLVYDAVWSRPGLDEDLFWTRHGVW